jgi:hypothetical protein
MDPRPAGCAAPSWPNDAARLWIVWLGGQFPPALAAQGDCFPATGSHEARSLALVSLPIVFSRVQAPEAVGHGLSFGLEAAGLPRVSDRLATRTVCRPGKGPEHINILPGLVRPRVSLAISHGLEVEGSWVPPVRVSGVKASVFGVALSGAMEVAPSGPTLGLRAHATFGVVHAPITCNDDALRDPDSECFGGTPSDDEFRPATLGVEAALGWPLLGGRLRPYGGAGYNRLRPRFRVNFTNSLGFTDRRRVHVNLNRAALFAGASWLAAGGMELTGEIYGAPEDGVTARLAVRARP